MVGLSLVAVFAIAAITAGSASAGPQWAKCEAQAGGNYTGPNCGKSEKAKPKGTGSFELFKAKEVGEKRVAKGKGKNVPFTGGSVGGGGVLATEGRECFGGTYYDKRVTRAKCAEGGGTQNYPWSGEPLFVECESETNIGEAEGTNKVANVNVTFKGCLFLGFIPCNSKGQAEGEIKTGTLKGTLGWINKSKKEVGVVLEPSAKHGLFASFDCPGFETHVNVGVGNKTEGTEYEDSPGVENHGGYDQIISPITPVNVSTTEFTQTYTYSNGPVANIPTKFEGKHISLLENTIGPMENPELSSGWSSAGEEVTNVNTSEEEGLIKA